MHIYLIIHDVSHTHSHIAHLMKPMMIKNGHILHTRYDFNLFNIQIEITII